MPYTPNNHLPYPVLTDTADVPRDIKALADSLDALLVAPPAGGGGASLQQLPILDVGMQNQHRAGRQLTPTDFTSRGLSTPLGLWNLSDTNDSSGNNRHLTNKTSVPFGVGINGTAATAAVFSGATNQALYIDAAGGSANFNIKTGSVGCWFRTAKRGAPQVLLSKYGASGQFGWLLRIETGNYVTAFLSTIGTDQLGGVATGTDACDDRWHFTVLTYDGTVTRLYIDGVLEATTSVATGPIFASTAPLNIGSNLADAGTNANNPTYGRVDEAFVTADVLSEDQVRGLYAGKVAHGYTLPPSSVTLSVRRRRRGGTLDVTDFPATPLRLYNFTAGDLAGAGSDTAGNRLLTNAFTSLIVSVAGADGATGNAYTFSGAHQGLTATDTGLPSLLAARSYGCWFKAVTPASNITLMGWGTTGSNEARMLIQSNGALLAYSGGDGIVGPVVSDGQWHLAVTVEDNAAGDLVKRKLYVDGRLVGGSTVLTSLTPAGGTGFRVGASPNAAAPFIGQLDGAFVYGGTVGLTFEQIAALYAKGSQALAPSPKNAGDHVEAVDATSLYTIFDTLDSTATVDLGVTA